MDSVRTSLEHGHGLGNADPALVLPQAHPAQEQDCHRDAVPRDTAETELHLRREGREVAERSGKRVAFVASSDQAHTHDKSGPYGYSKNAAVYDRKVVEAIEGGRLSDIMKFSPSMGGRGQARQPVADGHARGSPGGGPDDRKALLRRGCHLLRDAVRGLHQKMDFREARSEVLSTSWASMQTRPQANPLAAPRPRWIFRDPPLEEKAESEGDEDEDRRG